MGLAGLLLLVPLGTAGYWAYRQFRYLKFGEELDAVVSRQWSEGSGEGSSLKNEVQVTMPNGRTETHVVTRLAGAEPGTPVKVVFDRLEDKIAVRRWGKTETLIYLVLLLIFMGWIVFGVIFVIIRGG